MEDAWLKNILRCFEGEKLPRYDVTNKFAELSNIFLFEFFVNIFLFIVTISNDAN